MFDGIIAKLNITGARVIDQNNFGLIHENGYEYTLIKLTYNKTGDKVLHKDFIYNIRGFITGKHFIFVHFRAQDGNMCGLYVKSRRSNLVSKYRYVYVSGSANVVAKIVGTSIIDTKVLVYQVDSRNHPVFVVNYLGKKMNITGYLIDDSSAELVLLKLQNGRFRLGYRSSQRIKSLKPDLSTQSLRYWFLDFDADFEDVQYNPKLGDYYTDKSKASSLIVSQPLKIY